MDSFEMNKIAGAILFTLTMTLGLGILAEIVFSQHAPSQARLRTARRRAGQRRGGRRAGRAGGAARRAARQGLGREGRRPVQEVRRLPHRSTRAARTATGPNLYGVLGGPMAHKDDFAYSDAMKAHHDKGDTWTPENFFHFIAGPRPSSRARR